MSENFVPENMEGFINSLKIRLSEGQNIALPGLALEPYACEVIRRLNLQGLYVVTIDIAKMDDKKDLALAIINKFLGNYTRLKKLVIEFDLEHDDNMLLNFALDIPENLAQFRRRATVVLFTQFHEIQRIGGREIYNLMRSHLQCHKNVTYLFSGSEKDINKIFGNRNKAFFRFATIIPIQSSCK